MSSRRRTLGKVLSSCCLLTSFVYTIPAHAQRRNDTENWKAFSNRSGWSIRYPATWKIVSCVNCPDPTAPDVFVEFFPPANQDFGWVIVEQDASKPPTMRIDRWFNEIKETADQNPIIEEQKLSLNNSPALSVLYRNTSDGTEISTVYVVSGSQTFEISFTGDKPAQTQVRKLKNYPIYLKMVDSFKVKHQVP